ncbi:MAG: cytochrome c biogenesis protein ResB [Chloroflexi bacterium]|nr:cytochrome c biogenesis protein ResB [Chloroflexota bacterium]
MGRSIWRTLTSVRFAVLQITLLVVAGLIGTVLRQVPGSALRDPAAYAAEMAQLHQRYDGLDLLGIQIGPGMVDLFERLGFFRVFAAPWFVALLSLLVLSIFVCTLDRTPKLWRGVRRVTVEQPPAFFDLRLPERASFSEEQLTGAEVTAVLRGKRYRIRRAVSDDGSVTWIYGDRNQYMKMATLLTHLGLILFLAGGAVTAALGFETVVFVGEGQTAPVQAVGTPGNLLVKNISFEAPRRANGAFEDFRTDLAVYQDGRQIARKTIRVNDPLQVQGFVFHQNTFGPSADIEVHDDDGRLVWTGPIILAGEVAGLPQGFLTIPGSAIGMLLFLQTDTMGTPLLALTGLGPTTSDGSSGIIFNARLGVGATSDPTVTGGYAVTWTRPGAWTGMVIKNDPGAPIIWTAFGALIVGLMLSFYFPRRRVWARLGSQGGVQLAMLTDRYVNAEREFAGLLEDLSARSGRLPERANVLEASA